MYLNNTLLNLSPSEASENWSDFQGRYGRQGSCTKLLAAVSGRHGTSIDVSRPNGKPEKTGGMLRTISTSSMLMVKAAKPRMTNSATLNAGKSIRRSVSGSALTLGIQSNRTAVLKPNGKRRKPRKAVTMPAIAA